MPEPLDIFLCETCGRIDDRPGGKVHDAGRLGSGRSCSAPLVPVRVFREEDVRPLWKAAKAVVARFPYLVTLRAALHGLGAPPEWDETGGGEDGARDA